MRLLHEKRFPPKDRSSLLGHDLHLLLLWYFRLWIACLILFFVCLLGYFCFDFSQFYSLWDETSHSPRSQTTEYIPCFCFLLLNNVVLVPSRKNKGEEGAWDGGTDAAMTAPFHGALHSMVKSYLPDSHCIKVSLGTLCGPSTDWAHSGRWVAWVEVKFLPSEYNLPCFSLIKTTNSMVHVYRQWMKISFCREGGWQ